MWRSTPKLDFGLPKLPYPQSPRPMQRHYGIPQAQGPQGYPSTVTWQIMDDHGDDVIMRWCGFRKNRSLFSWRLFLFFFSCVDSHLWFLVVSYVLNGWLQELNFNHGCCPSLNFHTSPLSFSFYGNQQSGTGRLCRLHWVWKHICSPQVWAPLPGCRLGFPYPKRSWVHHKHLYSDMRNEKINPGRLTGCYCSLVMQGFSHFLGLFDPWSWQTPKM